MSTAAEMVTEELGEPLFVKGNLQVKNLADAVRAEHPCALTRDERVAMYENGVYRVNGVALSAAVSRLLGNKFKPIHLSAVTEYIRGRLHEEDLWIPDQASEPLLNVANGMLDLRTLQLLPWDPRYLSSTQLPVPWMLGQVSCPTYEAWLADIIPDQVDDLEETFATMLDPSRTPTKAALLFGPSRSGKSTYLRLAATMAGIRNVSAVTLHQLSENRFAAARVYGKILNSAADISSRHVEDISLFKTMTGEDLIPAERKYGGQFEFTNRALFGFSANELPTVGESSRAYSERIKPFAFVKSFAGSEDPQIEAAMVRELPGILIRWVGRYCAYLARGGKRLSTIPTVQQEFDLRSDRVRQWLEECCEITGQAVSRPEGAPQAEIETACPGAYLPAGMVTTKTDLATEFNLWARNAGGRPIGRNRVSDRLTSINGVYEVRRDDTGARGLNIRIKHYETGSQPWK